MGQVLSAFSFLQQLRLYFQRIEGGIAKLCHHRDVGGVSAVAKDNAVAVGFWLNGVESVPFVAYVGFKPGV